MHKIGLAFQWPLCLCVFATECWMVPGHKIYSFIFFSINCYWFRPFIWNKFTLDVIIIVAHSCDYFNFKGTTAAPNKTNSIFWLAAASFLSNIHKKFPLKSLSSIKLNVWALSPKLKSELLFYYWKFFTPSSFNGSSRCFELQSAYCVSYLVFCTIAFTFKYVFQL